MSVKRLSILFCSPNSTVKGPVYKWFEESDAQVLWVDTLEFATAMLGCFSVDAVVVPKSLDVAAFHLIAPKTPVFVDTGNAKQLYQQIQRVLFPDGAPLSLEVTASGHKRPTFDEDFSDSNALPDSPVISFPSPSESEPGP